jgi:hypothetical protein
MRTVAAQSASLLASLLATYALGKRLYFPISKIANICPKREDGRSFSRRIHVYFK